MKKKIISIILVLAMVSCMIPATALTVLAEQPVESTLRDILDKVTGTYAININKNNESQLLTITINSDEYRQNTIFFGEEPWALRIVLDNTGVKSGITKTFEDGQPVFNTKPSDVAEVETIDMLLSIGVEFTKAEKTLANDIVIPAESYIVGENRYIFYDVQNGKTQKMYIEDTVLNRIDDGVHKHTFSSAWSYSPTHHWHDSTCWHTEIVSGFGQHNFIEETTGNTTTYTCACGYQKVVYNDNEGELISGTSFTGISLTLDSDIFINFYMDLTDETRQNGIMTFNIGGRIVTGVKAEYNETENKYYFACPVTALEMNETVKATFTYNNVEYIQEYSVYDYIERIVGNKTQYGEKAVLLARKIANYGYYAQKYLADIHNNIVITEKNADTNNSYAEMVHFGTTDEGNVDINVSAAQTALANHKITVNGTTENLSLYGSTVYFDSATALNYYVTATNGVPTAAAANTVTDKNKNVEIKHYEDDIYIVSVKGITAPELADTITVTVNSGLTITGSVFAYSNAVMNKAGQTDAAKNAMAAFYEYYVAAAAYAATQK